jgi:AraC-like DNA-binding protein
MKPSFEKISYNTTESFKTEYLDFYYFQAPWHFHPEYELTFIEESTGRRYIGDSIAPFAAGDLVFVGPNLPHVWLNDRVFYEKKPGIKAKAVVIQFKDNYIPRYLLETPEFHHINNTLKMSSRGIGLKGNSRKELVSRIKELAHLSGIARFNTLLSILDIMGRSKNCEFIASKGFVKEKQLTIPDRLKKVINFINARYKYKIHVEEAADLVAMNKSAFCRYFKDKTGKTFSQFVNELRISYACKLLMENNFNVSQICYESGFNNLSNFNRQFKVVIGKTPQDYKNQYRDLKQN